MKKIPPIADGDPRARAAQMGSYLHSLRQKRGRTLQAIARILRVKQQSLACIEAGGLPNPPGPPYDLAMVRSYARYLRVDPDQVVGLYKPCRGSSQALEVPRPAEVHRRMKQWLKNLILIVFTVVLIVGLWLYGSDYVMPDLTDIGGIDGGSLQEEVMPDISGENTLNKPSVTVGIIPQPKVATVAAQGLHFQTLKEVALSRASWPDDASVVLEARDDCWVEIRDHANNSVIFSRILVAGERFHVPDGQDLRATIGNIGGLAVYIDGVLLEPDPGRGRVAFDVVLTPAKLQDLYGEH